MRSKPSYKIVNMKDGPVTRGLENSMQEKSHHSFSEFLPTQQHYLREDLYERLLTAEIKSLSQLLKFVRERYPDYYCECPRFQKGNGQQEMRRLWADYLQWAESN